MEVAVATLTMCTLTVTCIPPCLAPHCCLHSHPYSRVSAKNVYNEFIQDRHHVHMNSTKWLTLTEFVKYLGREGEEQEQACTQEGWLRCDQEATMR